MNFIQLVEDLRVASGSSSTGRDSFSQNPSHEHSRFRRWINDAWRDIQMRRNDWYFRQQSASHVMRVGANVMDSREWEAGDVSQWCTDSLRISEPGSGKRFSESMWFDDWKVFSTGEGLDSVVQGKPSTFSVRPNDNAIVVAPSAEFAYIIYYDYVRGVQELVGEQDEPIMPKDFHKLIVYQALMEYGQFEASQDSIQLAMRGRKRLMAELERNQLPQVIF